MPVNQGHGRDVSNNDVMRSFAKAPPHHLATSPLYHALPESKLHRSSDSIVQNSDQSQDISRLPPRLARKAMAIRPGSAPPDDPSRVICATSFMFEQHRAVEHYEKRRQEARTEDARERQIRWERMRIQKRETEQRTTSESVKKRRIRMAKQVAIQQLREQHDRERELQGYEERKLRTTVEGAERKVRYAMAYELWRGIQDIRLTSNIEMLVRIEVRERTDLLEQFVSDIEGRHRAAILRISSLSKSALLSSEKAARITLQKHLAAVQAWKNELESHVNNFFSGERKQRQKIYDEEAFGFLDIEGQKTALQTEQARIARRKAEELLAARREFENKQYNERVQMEKNEGDMRHAMKGEENNLRLLLRQDYSTEKHAAEQRVQKRLEREKHEWEQECQRQLQPIMDDEDTQRVEVAEDEESMWNQLIVLKRQEWDDILIPITIITPQGYTGETAYDESGAAVQPFAGFAFRRKMDIRHYPAGPIAPATLTIYGVKGIRVGDEVDIMATEVAAVKEKKGPGVTGLRIIDSSVIDEDGGALCTINHQQIPQLSEIHGPVEFEEAQSRLNEQMNDALPMLSLRFRTLDKDGITRALERVTHSIVLRNSSASTSYETRQLKMVLDFTCAKEKREGRTPRTNIGGNASPRSGVRGGGKRDAPRSTASSLNASVIVPTQSFLVSHTTTVTPKKAALHIAVPNFPGSHISTANVTWNAKKRAEGGKLFVPLFSNLDTSLEQNHMWGLHQVRIRFLEGYEKEDNICFPPSEAVHLKKGEIRSADGASIASVSGKLVPAAAASSKEVTLTFLDEKGTTNRLAQIVLQRLHFSNANPTPANGRRLLEMTLTGPGISANLRSVVNVIGANNENVSFSIDESTRVVCHRTCEMATPLQLWSSLRKQPTPFCFGTNLDAFGNLATKDNLAGGVLRVSVASNAYEWDSITITETRNNFGAVFFDNGRLLWSANPQAEVNVMQCIGKVRSFTHLEGAIRPGIHVDIADARVNAVMAAVRAMRFDTKPVTMETVEKTVAIELTVPEPQSRKAKAEGPAPTAVSLVSVLVKPACFRTTKSTFIVPRAPDPVKLDCFAFDGLDNIILEGGSLDIRFTEGSSGVEQLDYLPPTPPPAEGDAPAENNNSEQLTIVVGKETVLQKGSVPIGTVGERGMGKALVFNFTGKRRIDSPADAGMSIVNGHVVESILSNLTFKYNEADNILQKLLCVTLTDSFGAQHQCVVNLDITPIHMPSELDQPPETIYYRHFLRSLTGKALSIMSGCTITDEDTEYCGSGTMSAEPYVAFTAGDSLTLMDQVHVTNTDAKQSSITFQDHPVDPSKTSILFEGKEFAVCLNESMGVGNRLKFTIKNGTPLDLCTSLMHRIGYQHAELHPTRSTTRQILFKFNAGDEDVPDTKAVVGVNVQSPLLYTLPLYESISIRQERGSSCVFQKVFLGVSQSTPVVGDKLVFSLVSTQEGDKLAAPSSEEVYEEKGHLVVGIAAARALTGEVSVPTPGFSGVCACSFELKDNDRQIELVIKNSSVSVAAIVPLILTKIEFACDQHSLQAPPRTVTADWHRAATGEVGFLRCTVDVEVEDQMTELILESSILSAFENEDTRIAAAARVVDEDTEYFEEDAQLVVEVQNGISSQDFVFVGQVGDIVVDTLMIHHQDTLIGQVNKLSTSRRLEIQLNHCHIDQLQDLVRAITYCGKNCAGQSKLIQVFLRASAQVPPTTTNVQVTLLTRVMSLSKTPMEHSISAWPTKCISGLSLVKNATFSGSVITISLVQITSDEKCREINHDVDRLSMAMLPEHLIESSKGAISMRGGALICTFTTTRTQITFSFPKTTKLATHTNVADVLSVVSYDCRDDDLGGPGDKKKAPKKPKADLNRSRGPDKGRVGVEVAYSLANEDGTSLNMADRCLVDVV